MSTSYQILGTLTNFFTGEPHVWILRVKYETVESLIKWEDAKGKGPDEVVSLTLHHFEQEMGYKMADVNVLCREDAGIVRGRLVISPIFMGMV